MKHLKHLKTLMTVMILSLLTTVAISCGDEEEDPIIYTVTVMTAEGGSADASRYEVIAGEEVTLTAEPEEGYKFKCWMQNGAEVSTANPYTFIVNRNIVYIAKFIKEGEEGDNSDQPSEIKTFDILAEIEKEKISYADFEELRFAIEALGGEYDKVRDFKNDKSYKKIKGLDKKATDKN